MYHTARGIVCGKGNSIWWVQKLYVGHVAEQQKGWFGT